jgi:uncharacterized protein YoxC
VLNQKLGALSEQAHPLVQKVNGSLEKVEAMTAQVGERVNAIMDQTEHVVEHVSRKVETATSIAEEAITQPLIGAASVMAGLSSGWEAYRTQSGNEKGVGQE